MAAQGACLMNSRPSPEAIAAFAAYMRRMQRIVSERKARAEREQARAK